MTRDETPTPKHTPSVLLGPILAQLAREYALRLDDEAATVGRERMPNRFESCTDLARRMRYLMLEFERWAGMKQPSRDAMDQTMAMWRDCKAQADALRLPSGDLTP